MADLTLTITESITLNSVDQGATTSKTFSSIGHTSKRIVTCPASNTTTLLTFNTNVYGAAGAIDLEDTKYIRITNLDSSNSVNISLQLDSGEDNSAADLSITHLLEAGRSFLMGAPDEGAHSDDDAATIVTALTDLESIIVDPGSNSGQVEVFVASS